MNRLKELRKEKKLTQKELAIKTEIPYRTLQRWENGETDIKSNAAEKLADFFGVSVAYLLGYSDFEDDFDAYIAINKEEQNSELSFVKSIILSLISQNSLTKIENEYNNLKVGLSQKSKYHSLLKALDSLRDSDEGKLLIWFATLDGDDKAMLLNLAESLSNKTAKNS